MEPRYWLDKWTAQDIRFHKNEANPNLETYGKRLPKGRTLVPLCGKSLDLIWLARHGHEVIGAELSPLACEAFFRENQIPVTQSLQGSFTQFKADHLTLWCGDLFALPASACAGLTGIYDRASLVALPPDLRAKYAKKLIELSAESPTLHYLLVTFEYDQTVAAGPPFSVPEAEVHSLFGRAFHIELLDRHEDKELRGQPKFQAAPTLTESVYLLTK